RVPPPAGDSPTFPAAPPLSPSSSPPPKPAGPDRAASPHQDTPNGQRPTANGQRPTANGQRPTANGQRQKGCRTKNGEGGEPRMLESVVASGRHPLRHQYGSAQHPGRQGDAAGL